MAIPFSSYNSKKYRTFSLLEEYKFWPEAFDSMLTDDLDIALLRELITVPLPNFGTVIDLGWRYR